MATREPDGSSMTPTTRWGCSACGGRTGVMTAGFAGDGTCRAEDSMFELLECSEGSFSFHLGWMVSGSVKVPPGWALYALSFQIFGHRRGLSSLVSAMLHRLSPCSTW